MKITYVILLLHIIYITESDPIDSGHYGDNYKGIWNEFEDLAAIYHKKTFKKNSINNALYATDPFEYLFKDKRSIA